MKSKPFLLVEFSLVFISFLVWFASKKISLVSISLDQLIDFTLVALIFIATLAHTAHPRHYWLGFFLVCLSALTNIFKFDELSYLAASLSLGVFFIAIVNHFFFSRRKSA